MGKTTNTVLVVAGLAGLMAVVSRQTLAMPGAGLDEARIRALAAQTVSQNGWSVDPEMLVAMASIESNFNPMAMRFEPHIGDASIGLMQTLLSTARWLATDMNYTAYGVPSLSDLMKPEISMYFGGAYVNWLRTWKGITHDEQWIVMSYNGGPGADNNQTRNHWAKYYKARYGG